MKRFLELTDASDKVDLDTDVVPKKFVEKMSLPPIVNFLGEDPIFKEKYDEDDGGRDGLIKSTVDSKQKNSVFYYVLRK